MVLYYPAPEKELSVDSIRDAIEVACKTTNERLTGKTTRLRIGSEDDVPAVLSLMTEHITEEDAVRDFDRYQLIVLEEIGGEIVGFAVTYWAYSTWSGRHLYLNYLSAPDEATETSFVYTLADISVSLLGQRVVWQHYESKSELYKSLKAEFLDGWLTLRMGTEGMDAFLQSRGLQVNMPLEGSMTSHHVNEAISDALRIAGKSDSMELYLASEQDMHHIERLVYGLSVYEKETDVIHVNRQHYVVDMSLYKCLLMKNRNDEHVCGMAFFYFGYDLSRGSFLYLEDLFIEEPYRGDGGGTLAMVALASVARTLGCTGWVWQALDWNTPALNFYHKLGAKVLRGLLTTRFNGPDLKEFLDNRPLKV